MRDAYPGLDFDPPPTPAELELALHNATQVATDEEGRSRGFGFVHFDSESAAQGCINDANGRIINGKEVRQGARNLSFLCSGCRLVVRLTNNSPSRFCWVA